MAARATTLTNHGIGAGDPLTVEANSKARTRMKLQLPLLRWRNSRRWLVDAITFERGIGVSG